MAALYGIIGYPLAHSFSPSYFRKKFVQLHIDAVYNTYPIADINEVRTLFAKHTFSGLNVTIPYKQSVIPYLNDLDVTARAIGAVNCIAFSAMGSKGYNTDAMGFKQSLVPLLQPQHKEALILGTGGAAVAVAYVLNELGIAFQYVSRTVSEGQLTYAALNEEILSTHTLIINTTPLGMYPITDSCPPIPYPLLGKRHLLYDLIYNPDLTLFLENGMKYGTAVKNGLEMLHLQAEAGWKIWQEQ